jgi:uncharacterized membrane protein
MNEKARVVLGFFTVRVFLVGAIMLAFPRIARKGLMFGSYLGEAQAEGFARRSLLRSWDRGCVLIMAVALVVGWSIGLSGRAVPGNLIGTVVLLLPFVPLYLWVHGKSRWLTPLEGGTQASASSASLDVDEGRGQGFALLALALSIIASLSLLIYALVSTRSMPPRIPTIANLWGYGEGLTDRPLVSVVLIPSFNLLFAPFFALMALLVARAKRSVRSGSGGLSAPAQGTFRVAVSHLFAGTSLFLCLFLGVISREMIRVWQGRSESPDAALIFAVAIIMVVYMGVGLFRIMWLGQGGARLEMGSPDAPLTGGLADNALWILGIWYINPDDPALLVESRFGIGYTMNLGNRMAWLILGGFLTGLLGLSVLTLAEAGVF